MAHHLTDSSSLEAVLDHWDDEITELGNQLIEKYGEPDEVTPARLTWSNTGPWKRTVLRRKGADHHFPIQHHDHLEQVIDYHVPPEKAEEVLAFDGSLTIRRTRGELSTECKSEAANFLAINLAHDVLIDEKSTAEAREAYADLYRQNERGETPSYCADFQFELPEGDQTHPDSQVIGSSKEEHGMDLASETTQGGEEAAKATKERQEAEAAADEETAKQEVQESGTRERHATASANPDAHRDEEPFSS